jgi:hypothetical protein
MGCAWEHPPDNMKHETSPLLTAVGAHPVSTTGRTALIFSIRSGLAASAAAVPKISGHWIAAACTINVKHTQSQLDSQYSRLHSYLH